MPYDIYWVHEDNNVPVVKLDQTKTPGAALSRMNDSVHLNDERKLGQIEHSKEEGGGHTLASETKGGSIIGRTSVKVKQ